MPTCGRSVLVAKAAWRRVRQQDVDGPGVSALEPGHPTQEARGRRAYSRWLYWFGPGR